jgi:hypothetical protein
VDGIGWLYGAKKTCANGFQALAACSFGWWLMAGADLF